MVENVTLIIAFLAGLTKIAEVIWSHRYRLLTFVWVVFLLVSSVLLITYNEPEGSYQKDRSSQPIHHSSQSI